MSFNTSQQQTLNNQSNTNETFILQQMIKKMDVMNNTLGRNNTGLKSINKNTKTILDTRQKIENNNKLIHQDVRAAIDGVNLLGKRTKSMNDNIKINTTNISIINEGVKKLQQKHNDLEKLTTKGLDTTINTIESFHKDTTDRFTNIDKQFKDTNQRIDNSFKYLDEKTDSHFSKLIKKMDNEFKQVDQTIEDLDIKIDEKFIKLDTKIDQKFKELRDLIIGSQIGVNGKYSREDLLVDINDTDEKEDNVSSLSINVPNRSGVSRHNQNNSNNIVINGNKTGVDNNNNDNTDNITHD